MVILHHLLLLLLMVVVVVLLMVPVVVEAAMVKDLCVHHHCCLRDSDVCSALHLTLFLLIFLASLLPLVGSVANAVALPPPVH